MPINSFKIKQCLVNMLVERSILGNWEARQSFIEELPPEIKYHYEHSNTITLDVLHLVDRCTDQVNGLEILIDRLHQHKKLEQSLLDHLHMLCDLLTKNGLPDSVNAELLRLLEPIRIDDLVQVSIYRASLPRAIQIKEHPGSLENIIGELFFFPPELGMSEIPLLEFIARMASYCEDTIGNDKIRTWCVGTLPLLYPSITEEQVESRWQSISQQPLRPIYKLPVLTVVIQGSEPGDGVSQDHYGKTYYQTSFWFSDQALEPMNVAEINEPLTMEAIQHRFEQVLNELVDYLGAYYAELTIEFYTSNEMLHLNFERWLWMNDAETARPIGYHFPIVVRPLKRLKSKPYISLYDLERYWRSCWQCQFPVQDIYMCNEQENPEQLYDFLRQKLGSHYHRIGIPFLPSSGEKTPLLDIVIQSGAPVTIWSRAKEKDPGAEQCIREILGYDPPENMLNQIRLLRREHWNNPTSTVNQLVMMFDNPNRIPKKLDPRRQQPPRLGFLKLK